MCRWFSNLYSQFRHLFLPLVSYTNSLFNIWICHRHLKTDVKSLFLDIFFMNTWYHHHLRFLSKKFRSYSSSFTLHICLLLLSNVSLTSVKFTFSVFQICLFIFYHNSFVYINYISLYQYIMKSMTYFWFPTRYI